MSKIFNVPLLNGMSHTDETSKILALYTKYGERSTFIRASILEFANKRKYKHLNILGCDRPKYIIAKNWKKIVETQEKATKKLYFVDCNFAVAFWWLRSLPEFKYCNKSELMRKIIIDCQRIQIQTQYLSS